MDGTIPEKEIGGYLELEHFHGEHYHKDAIRLNCCRSGLLYVFELRGVRRIWLPDFLCDSVEKACDQAGVKVKTYAIGMDLLPDYSTISLQDDDYILLVDYYGQLTEDDVVKADSASNGRLIVDETQGFFRRPWAHADTVYSCRKFFGVPDGAYLVTHDGATLDRELEPEQSRDAMMHLLGRFERPASEYYQEYVKNDSRFDGQPMRRMSLIADNILRAIDYEGIKETRERNFTLLSDMLREHNRLQVHATEGPFSYPFLIEGPGDIRKRMAIRGVYVPTLWPNVLTNQNASCSARNFAGGILPLPVDQRCNAGDINDVLQVLSCYFS